MIKPTLFADDLAPLLEMAREMGLTGWNDALDATVRILPSRCSADKFLAPLLEALPPHTATHTEECQCDGLGWMWPDQPPETQPLSEVAYHIRLETIWTAMDILE